VCPGISGGFLYNSPSFDPHNDRLISGSVDWCSTLHRDSSPPRYQPGREFSGGRQEHTGLASGWVTSVSAVTGNVVWRFHTDAPVFAAVTTTAGGVSFTGDHAGRLYALRTDDGALLWSHETGGSIAGGIITYQIGKRQYLAVTSGTATLSPPAAAGPPSIIILGLSGGSTGSRE
jgi:outer membrane protein assembly factor BamB